VARAAIASPPAGEQHRKGYTALQAAARELKKQRMLEE
jgi:hypothetical protein